MLREIRPSFRIAFNLLVQALSRPAWLMALFIFLACLIPFAGGTSSFRGDAIQILDPFSFSLLTPSRHAFGPHSMLMLTGLFVIPASLLYWRRMLPHIESTASCDLFKGGVLPIAALSLYGLFILLSLPLIARSTAFPGPRSFIITILDLISLGVFTAWTVEFSLKFVREHGLQAVVAWITAGAIYMIRGMVDSFLIAPEAGSLVETDWTLFTTHFLMATGAVTLHALPIRYPRRSVFLIPSAFILFLGTAAPVHADNPARFEISGSIGFNGYYKTQTCVPVNLHIENHGDMFSGVILVEFSTWVPPSFYSQPVTIPPSGSIDTNIGSYGCYALGQCDIPVSILGQNGDPYARIVLQAHGLGDIDTLFVHIGEPVEPIDHLFIGNNPGFLVMASRGFNPSAGLINYPPKIFPTIINDPNTLPRNPFLLESVGVLAMGLSTYLGLDSDVKNTILQYIRHGGKLIIYYRAGIDPVNGWTGDSLLPVEPSGETWQFSAAELLDTVSENELLNDLHPLIPAISEEIRRGINGDIITRISNPELWLEYERLESKEWDQPDKYMAIGVEPQDISEVVRLKTSDHPILIWRNLGGGRAAFAAFNPFAGEPASKDAPISLLALHSLLDPASPVTSLKSNALMAFKELDDARINDFFQQGSSVGKNWAVKWMEALGPALIYLIVLPLIVIFARRRGNVILALFIIWSVIFTITAIFWRNYSVDQKININQASLYWCEALTDSDSGVADIGASQVYTCLSYNANSSMANTLFFDYPDGLIDEFVDPYTWPYGSLSIEYGQPMRLPDIRVEPASYISADIDRTFVYRRIAPELTASGALTVSPNTGHFTLDAILPHEVVASRLIVNSYGLWVGKNLDIQGTDVHLDFDLAEGTEINRHENIFPDDLSTMTPRQQNVPQSIFGTDIGYPLERLWEIVFSMPVGRAQVYTQPRGSDRPQQAFVILASTNPATKAEVARGEITEHSLTIIVITVPILYEN